MATPFLPGASRAWVIKAGHFRRRRSLRAFFAKHQLETRAAMQQFFKKSFGETGNNQRRRCHIRNAPGSKIEKFLSGC
jgi:hypothetical protein